MNFDIDDDQRNMAELARKFFAEQSGPGFARSLHDGVGKAAPGSAVLAELGFSSLTIPEEFGGVGSGVLEMALVAEQAGRQLAAPSLATAARAANLLEGCREQLRAVSEGQITVAVVDGSPSGSRPSMDATWATHFLALDGEDLVFGPGRVTAGEAIDATRGLGYVEMTAPQVLATSATSQWERAKQVGCVVLAAEGLGAAERALEMGIDHAKQREAFGRPIGSYQAIKHRLVDDWVAIDQLRSLVWWAAWTADHAPDQLALAAAAAKAHCAATFESACETLIHTLGAIGYTWEHDAHLYWRRAKVDRLLLGDESEHLVKVALLSIQAETQAANSTEATDSPPFNPPA